MAPFQETVSPFTGTAAPDSTRPDPEMPGARTAASVEVNSNCFDATSPGINRKFHTSMRGLSEDSWALPCYIHSVMITRVERVIRDRCSHNAGERKSVT